jgi:hypothetical protein
MLDDYPQVDRKELRTQIEAFKQEVVDTQAH